MGFPFGYGAGPGCSGLTPSQDNSIYDAPNGGPRVQGAGVNAAVFELSGYQQSDIDTWAHQFYGKHYTPPLIDINVDGGPLNPICPTGDTVPAELRGLCRRHRGRRRHRDDAGDLTGRPSPLVYNAPNDYTGQTEIDEYTAIANQDTADTLSSSWGVCENDAGAALRPGRERDLRADGRPGPEHVRRRRRHRSVRLHPLGRHDDRQCASIRRPSHG